MGSGLVVEVKDLKKTYNKHTYGKYKSGLYWDTYSGHDTHLCPGEHFAGIAPDSFVKMREAGIFRSYKVNGIRAAPLVKAFWYTLFPASSKGSFVFLSFTSSISGRHPLNGPLFLI